LNKAILAGITAAIIIAIVSIYAMQGGESPNVISVEVTESVDVTGTEQRDDSGDELIPSEPPNVITVEASENVGVADKP